MSQHKDMQKAVHHYRQVHHVNDVDMRDVARYAVEKLGMKLPEPKDPLERLASEFSKAAREENRYDKGTGRPYRVNHMYIDANGQRLWLDIDGDAPRGKMLKSLTLRREQVIGDAYHMELDADHWNAAHAGDEPLQLVLDFTADVAERKAIDGDDDDKAAE
jgi:hypothetical protein